jgi:hypothetical protein
MYPAEFNKAKPALNLDFGAIREMYNALDFYGISAYSGLRCAPGQAALYCRLHRSPQQLARSSAAAGSL